MNDLLGPRFIPTLTLGNKVLTQDSRGIYSITSGTKSSFDNRVLDIKGNTIGHLILQGTRDESLKRW